MSPEESERMVLSEYWDERYSEVEQDKQLHEWFKSFSDIESFLDKHLLQVRKPDTSPRILHLGSGDSTVPVDLWGLGYRDQLCVDFSPVIVKRMSERHSINADGIKWLCMDVRHMEQISSDSIDVAFDKGTLDAMVHGDPWSPPDDVRENTAQYMREVSRILKPDGVFLYVTYRQPHFVKRLLNCEGTKWDLKVDVLNPAAGSFEYYGFALKKAIASEQ